MKRKVSKLTALTLIACYIFGLVSCVDAETQEYDAEFIADTQYKQDVHKTATTHSQTRARCLEKVTVIHTPKVIRRLIPLFRPFLHRKQSIKTLQHSRPPSEVYYGYIFG